MKIFSIFLKFLLIIILFSFNSCDEDVSRTEPEEIIIGNGKIFVSSDPANSQIFLDGFNYGSQTPDTLIWIDEGIHQITLKKPLFVNVSFSVRTSNDSICTIIYDYHTDPQQVGNINCKSSPSEANIFVNELNSNQVTPSTITNLFPGQYLIRFKKDFHLDRVISCDVSAQKTTNITAYLIDTTDFITYNKEYFNCPDDYQTFVLEDISRNSFWIGTSMNGLLKFHNIQWENYKGEQYNFHSDNITCLKLDNQNNLWICNYMGVVKYDGVTWIDYSTNVDNNFVTSIDFDSEGNAWIGTRNGIYKFNGTNWIHYHTSNKNIPNNQISDIAIDVNDVIWVGTEVAGLMKLENNIWTIYTISDSLLFNSISSVDISEDGKIYCGHFMSSAGGTYGGISIFDGISWNKIYDEIARTAVRDIDASSTNSNIWVATDRGLLLIDTQNQRRFFNPSNSLIPSNDVRKVIIDKDDNVWISSMGGGLTKFKKGDLYIIQN
ncbi:MAG: PEGA domain-containing protein [Ignavibacteriales bacterium]|nr:PEGA domain-containing protein [Ignavibacteriales bacterium]